MSGSGSSSIGSGRAGSGGELDDPGRDPKGIGGPPRNPMGGGPDQDSGRGEPTGSPGTEGESMMPESPDGDDERV
ncbi:hypothetical protein JKP76_10500 [Blastococcus sp. TML/C7B]|uniref:hypothetical protein n=1 Tax=Blastococcus sp. TML/C7B TaxID=2798728 RepID=UPI00190C6068|nr:hypothetical protein [Blastococcus sp. TML/C7B]MBN1096417.1 hypothetical protein [Blastococcus sp. TML/C7B]